MRLGLEDPMFRKKSEEALAVPSAELVKLIDAQRGHMSARQRLEGVQSLVARLTERRRGIRLSAKSIAISALVASLIVFGVVTGVRWRPVTSALSYTIDDGHVATGGLIEAASSIPPRLRFSDGTEVLLRPETKASLRSVDSHGARVSLIEGSAHVDVVHKSGASWLFDAGPFLVVVTGTAFTVQWTPLDEQLDLKMERGTVEVSGPLSDGTILLRSSQHLVVRVRQRQTLIQEGEDTGESKPPPLGSVSEKLPASPAAQNVGAAEMGTGSSSSQRPSQGPGERDWPAAVARGDYETIVRQAERRGLDGTLSEASSVDIAALADAARYGRHDDVARRALMALRRRFPVSSAARDASFLLGRLEETRRAFSGAVEWYDQYLAESPLGTYASEALGRKMNLMQQVYGDERARPVAEEYLGRFPQGTYAARARALARGQ
jgi:ferric-dicitrate binding protein FerR (iron transport regulator)